MTELTLDTDVQAPTSAPEPAVLITESEVLLSSAAALAGPAVAVSRTRSRWRMVFRSRPRPHPKRNHTRRPSFIEDAMMARMMERL